MSRTHRRPAAKRGPFASLLRRESGYAILEMAIVMPAFALLLFGIFEFSVAITGYLGSCYAVRTTARFGALHSLTSMDPAAITDLQTMVKAGPFVPSGNSTSVTISYVTYQGSTSGNLVGNVLCVQIVYPQTISLPGFSQTFNIGSTAYRMILH